MQPLSGPAKPHGRTKWSFPRYTGPRHGVLSGSSRATRAYWVVFLESHKATALPAGGPSSPEPHGPTGWSFSSPQPETKLYCEAINMTCLFTSLLSSVLTAPTTNGWPDWVGWLHTTHRQWPKCAATIKCISFPRSLHFLLHCCSCSACASA